MLYSTSRDVRRRQQANDIRSSLIEEYPFSDEKVNVKIIGVPKDGTAEGPYMCIGSLEDPRIDEERPDLEELTAELAHSVLLGRNIFYARCLFRSERGNFGIRVLHEDGRKGFGFLDSTKRDGYDKKVTHAEQLITEGILKGLSPGDDLIVRLNGRDPYSRTMFFEPVVNFREGHGFYGADGARSPEGRELVTKIEGYEKRALITDLPTPTLREDSKRSGLIAVGHVKRPEKEKLVNAFYHKPVFVIKGDKYKGKFIPKSEVLVNGEKIILAKVIN